MTTVITPEMMDDHGKWLRSGGKGGTRLVLTDADLRRAYLTGADLTGAYLTGADLAGADLTGADLTGADLTGADLTGADLAGADLRRAYLTGADLTGADLTGAYLTGADLTDDDSIPAISGLFRHALKRVESNPGCFDMGTWHSETACGTTHCLAGHIVDLAGPAGYALEAKIGPAAAGALIALKSAPWIGKLPNFFTTNEDGLAQLRELAAREKAQAPAEPAT